MPIQEKCRVLVHQPIGPRFYQLTLLSRDIATQAQPGQFVEVKCADGYVPLLRRPISLHRIDPQNETFTLLYEVVGQGTELLAKAAVGAELDILGPLGTGFKIDPAKKTHLLVGGGMGVAPLMALAEEVKIQKSKACLPDRQVKSLDLFILIGARNKECVQCEGELKAVADQVIVSTDDGSYGQKGFVSDQLLDIINNRLSVVSCQSSVIYACGPRPMLKAVAQIAAQKQIDCQLSLEERMACGIGACKGCAVLTTSGYKMVCKDGPVFNASDLVFS
ncbi:MAG: dihydroorotate dehydrogenase electron transfer subunit [Candidatus Margulisbacteria bacterium]|jgi:dihydroorotate dehydrogenase electron transfer subunit|nr:dihydroorotate dehydrogenase electron transfer subunit [Candidatus Margulisiibacteriota bacterium]